MYFLGDGPESVGVFSCSDGYYLEGKQTVECNLFGEWESDLPVCRGILTYICSCGCSVTVYCSSIEHA